MFPGFRETNCHLPNQRAGVDAGFGLLFAFRSHLRSLLRVPSTRLHSNESGPKQSRMALNARAL